MLASLTYLVFFLFSAAPAQSDESVSPEGNEVVSATIEAAVPHLEAAIQLAGKGAGEDKNFASLAKGLTRFGFGNPPVSPPWLNERDDNDLSGEDLLAAEDRRKEALERIKRLGQDDITYLKMIDANGDLETDEAEMRGAIRENLNAELKDKLNVDGDGDLRLDIQEYALAVPSKGKKDEDGIDWHQRGHFQHDDKNDDGYLDITEMIGHEARAIIGRALLIHLMFLLPEIDSDGNGEISENEFSDISEEAKTFWDEASPDDEPIIISEAYPSLYWLSNDSVSTLLPK